MDTFTETSTAQDQAVAAVNLGEEGPSSVSEAVSHPDVTAIQQHIVGDVVSSGRENGKRLRKPGISKTIIVWPIKAELIETLLALTDVTSMEIKEIIFALTCAG